MPDSSTASAQPKLAEGPPLAAVIERHAVATEAETHELLGTHNFLIAWFVRHALDAPPARWMGLNQANCALTVILYRPELPPSLLTLNDMSHLHPHLRWSGFPGNYACKSLFLNLFSESLAGDADHGPVHYGFVVRG